MNKVILHLTSLEKGGAAQFTFDYHRQMLAEGYESYVAVRGHKCLFPDGTWHSINHSSNKWERFKRYLFRKRISNIEINKQYSVFNLCERFTCHSAQDTLAVLPHNPDVVYVHWVSDYANAKMAICSDMYSRYNDESKRHSNILSDSSLCSHKPSAVLQVYLFPL